MSVTRAVSGVVVVVGCVAVVSASAATPAKKAAPRIVAALMQDADRDGRADGVAAHVLGSDSPCARSRRSLSARRHGLPDPLRRRRERQDARAGARREGPARRCGSPGDPLSADAAPAGHWARHGSRPRRSSSRGARPHGNKPSRPPPRLPRRRRPRRPGLRRRRWGRRRHCRRARLRPAGQAAFIRGGRPARPRLRRLELRRDRRHREGCDLRLPDGERRRSRHEGEAEAADPRGGLRPRRSGRRCLAAAGTYGRVEATTGVGVYGGYDPATWARRSR